MFWHCCVVLRYNGAALFNISFKLTDSQFSLLYRHRWKKNKQACGYNALYFHACMLASILRCKLDFGRLRKEYYCVCVWINCLLCLCQLLAAGGILLLGSLFLCVRDVLKRLMGISPDLQLWCSWSQRWTNWIFKGQLQRKFFISINELLLHQITIYVIKSL